MIKKTTILSGRIAEKILALNLKLNIFGDGGPKYQAPASHTPGNDYAQEILYHRMQISVSEDLAFYYDYLEGSGTYTPPTTPITDDQLDGYIRGLLTGAIAPQQGLHNMPSAAPNIKAIADCYILIELIGPPSLIFLPDKPAIEIKPEKWAYYDSIYHYDTGLDRHAGTAPAPAEEEPCYIVCFGLKDCQANDLHPFSINLQIAQASGNTIIATVDPHIKNRGGTGSNSMGRGGAGANYGAAHIGRRRRHQHKSRPARHSI